MAENVLNLSARAAAPPKSISKVGTIGRT